MEENHLPEPEFYAKDSIVNVEVYNQNAVFDTQNVVFDEIRKRIETGADELKLYKISKDRLIDMFNRYSTVQVFYRSLLMDDYHISSYKAGDLINALKAIGVIESVKGQGKGKYRFKL